MTSNEPIQYLQQRTNGKFDDKKNSDDIYNRRSNTTHVNFRKAVYQSLALPYAYDEYHSIISYVKYCIKIFFACIFILLIGSLIKYAWCFNRH